MLNQDIIIYSANGIFNTNEKKLKKCLELSSFYDPKFKAEKITKEVVNPSEELQNIAQKLTKKELFILRYCYFK